MSGGFLEGIWKVSGSCWEGLEDIRKVSGGYLECVILLVGRFFNVLLTQFPSPHIKLHTDLLIVTQLELNGVLKVSECPFYLIFFHVSLDPIFS